MKIEDLRIKMKVSVWDGQDFNGEVGAVAFLSGKTKNHYENVGIDFGDGYVVDEFKPEHLTPVIETTPIDDQLKELADSLPYLLGNIKIIYQQNKSLEKTKKFCQKILAMGYDPLQFMNMIISK